MLGTKYRRPFAALRPAPALLSPRSIQLEPLERRDLLTAVTTDAPDYSPGATAYFYASGFRLGETVQFQVTHTDGTPNTGGGHQPWTVQDGSIADLDGRLDGNIATSWYVDPDDSNGASFLLTTLGLDSGLAASTTFTDAGSTLSQYANLPTTAYQSGSLNSSNSAYVEGSSIPFRYLVSGLQEGGRAVIDISYQFQSSAGGPQTYDYLTGDTASEAITDTNRFGGTNGSKPAGFGLTSSTNLLLVPIPDDGSIGTDTGGSFRLASNVPLSLVSVSSPAIGSNPDEKHIQIIVQLGNDGDATPNEKIVDLGVFWGGHLARDTDYAGANNGASDAPGASFHMTVDGFQDLNANGTKDSGEDNLSGGDRSIQAGVVVHTSLAWEKRRSDNNALLGGATFTVTPNPLTGSGALTITDNGPLDADPDLGQFEIDDIPFGTYTITETAAPTGFSIDSDATRVQTVTAGAPNAVVGTQGTIDPGTTDESDFFNTPLVSQVAINKVTVDGATSGDGMNIQTGEAISWRYTVTNPGNVALSNVSVTDNQAGVTPAYVSGDTNNNSKLDPNETWIYSAAGTAITGNYSNTGTVQATDPTNAPVTASDSSSYFGVDPEIAINKVTVDGATSGDGLNILTGESIAWKYTVTNVGNVALSNVSVTDNQAGVSPVYQSGDTNNNSKLDLGETWVYAANGTAITGNYSNTGTASGSYVDSAGHSRSDSASDGSSYFGVDPQIAINKLTVDGATSGDGLNILTGESIGWKYTVTNVAHVAQGNVSVTDNQPGVTPILQSGDTNNDSKLDLGETWVYTASGSAITGSYSNTGTASGSYSDSAGHLGTDSASDASSYFGVDPEIAINTVTVDGATSGDGLNILTGESIGWKCTVTNVGNVALSNVGVTDNQAGVSPVYQSGDTNNNSKLDLGETWVYTANGTAITGSYSNTGTASGSYTDSSGHSRSDSASDGSSYFGVDPQIAINKVTVDGATSGDGLNILTGEPISWRYTVTNVGNIALSNVSVTDNQPGVTTVLQSGDANNNGLLDLSETWVYTANGTAITGSYSNTGTASGSYTDSAGHSRLDSASDGSSYIGIDPEIAINKVTVDGATSGDGLNILTGEPISWRYTVTNVGNVALSDVSVTDNQPGVTPVLQSGDTNNNSKLDLGETWVYTASGSAITGSYSNTGTASGSYTDSAGHLGTDSASDASSYFGVDPQIAINKVTVDGATSGDGLNILTGESIGWRYTVTNVGNVALSNVSVTDNQAGVTPVLQSGDTNNNSKLDLGETWVYAAAGTAITGSYSNTGTASGSYTDSAGHSRTDSASDGSSYFGVDPQIAINKVTVDGATSGDGLNILTGESISWKYTVTNVGNVALSNVSVTDNQPGVTPVLQSGDTNNNSKLDLGETWVYTASGSAITGNYSNTGTASGSYTDSSGHSRPDSASDGSSYFGVDPEIAINKVTKDGATSGDGLNILTGEAISWLYTVTNVGNVALSSVSVIDNQPGVTPVYQSGDANNNSKLDLGESWVYAAAGTAVTGSYSNTGTASGSYSDSAGHSRTDSASDGSSYFGADPQIAINKVTVNGANSGDGLTIPVGAPITWLYTVTNVGNVALSNVSVTDNKPGVTPVLQSGDTNNNAKLDLGETWIYTAAGTAVSGNYSNIGTASGSYTDSTGHSRSDTATDGSSYYGSSPQIAINKVTVDGATSGDGLNILSGEAITWRYTVTNIGNVSVSNVAVTDNQPGVTPVYQSGDTNTNSKLDLGEIWVYTANGTAITGNYSNLGTVTGTDTTGASVQASDSSSYFGVDPKIAINKVTVDGATSGDGLNILTGEAISWRYTVTNVGNTALSNVSVTDNQPGVSPVYQSGDTNNNSKLDLGETWVYAAAGTAITGNYSNTGTASGKFTDSAGHSRTASASDGSSYFGVDPQIAINKVTVDGATSGDGLNIHAGEAISWRYTVTNVGNIALSNVSVTDNQPGVTPVLQSGDTNNNAKLDLGETWVYTANGTAVTGNYSNTGTASGKFTDSNGHSRTDIATDASSYFGAVSQIAVKDQVSVDNGVTWLDADTATGPTALAGSPVKFRVIVTNTGNVALSNVNVTNTAFAFTGVVTSLAAGASDVSDIYTTSVIVGQYEGTATAIGTFSDSAGHAKTASSSDQAHYIGRRDTIVIAPDKQNTSTSLVKVVDKNTGAIISQFYAYEPNFTGGVRVATGDMNGDGIDEIITAPGRGRAPEIRVFTQDGVELAQFRTMAYANTYVGGVQVDVGDVNGDGKNDIVVAPSTGATQVRIFYNNYNPANPNADPIADTPSKQFNVYSSSFLGGADVAVADMGKFSNGATLSATTPDGKAEVIVGNGPGMRSTVYVYDVSGTPKVVDTILPLSNTYSGGITLDAGRVNADAIPDLIVAGGNAGGSTVEVWSGIVNDVTDVKLASFTTFANTTTPNMPVHATWIDSNGDGIVDSIVAVQGTDGTSNQIRSFGTNGALQNTLNGFTGSWNIAAIHHSAGTTAAAAVTTLAAPLSAASLVTTTKTSPSTTTKVATTPAPTPPTSPTPQPTAVTQPTIVSAQTTVKKTVSAQAADAIYSTLGSTLTH